MTELKVKLNIDKSAIFEIPSINFRLTTIVSEKEKPITEGIVKVEDTDFNTIEQIAKAVFQKIILVDKENAKKLTEVYVKSSKNTLAEVSDQTSKKTINIRISDHKIVWGTPDGEIFLNKLTGEYSKILNIEELTLIQKTYIQNALITGDIVEWDGVTEIKKSEVKDLNAVLENSYNQREKFLRLLLDLPLAQVKDSLSNNKLKRSEMLTLKNLENTEQILPYKKRRNNLYF